MSTFPPWEAVGDQIRKWTEDPNEPGCTIARITLTLETLPNRSGWDVNSDPERLFPEHYRWLRQVGIVTNEGVTNEQSPYRGTIVLKNEGSMTSWTGMTGPAVIFINNIERAKNSGDPYISELTKAVYEKDFELEDLKHIWMTDVQNHDTINFINTFIYGPGAEIQYPHNAIITWSSEHAHFNALFGTALGKVVGYFILGAFGQGVKRVARIRLFRSFGSSQLQFDIENV